MAETTHEHNEKARREAEDIAMNIPDEHHRNITMDCIRSFYDLMQKRIARETAGQPLSVK